LGTARAKATRFILIRVEFVAAADCRPDPLRLPSEIIEFSGANVSSQRRDETILFYDETILRICADNRKQR